MKNALIVGGSGGIGYGLVHRYLASRNVEQVHGTYYRNQPALTHPRLKWHRLDITDETSIASLSTHFTSLNMVINTVGFLHGQMGMPEKAIRQITPEFFLHNMSINALPSLLLAKHFQNSLKAAEKSLFAVISAKVGSIGDNRLGGWYSYRASKAALNMAMKNLSIEWQRSVPQCCVALLHPGTTDTPLSKPFQAHVPEGKLFSTGQSAEYILSTLSQLTPEDSGRFWSWDGTELPW